MAEADSGFERNAGDYRRYVDMERGTVDREIFSSEEIYRKELEQIFARAWNFMCHESQIAKPGDFFCNFIGEESVIATRDKKGQLQVFLNTCRHRGNAVCRADSGHASSFMCTYHGWTYDLEGKLKGVPGFRDLYHGELDKSQWGLIKAGRVESYKGFVFATMDPDAPPLEEFLGEVGRMGMDQIAARGEMWVIDGVQKYVVDCNWKIVTDNTFDWYHGQVTHSSVLRANQVGGPPSAQEIPADVREALSKPPVSDHHQRVVLGEYGHAIGGPRLTPEIKSNLSIIPRAMKMPVTDHEWRERPEAQEQLGDVGLDVIGHPNIFPSLFVATNGLQLQLRLPKGPNSTEIWWFTLAEKREDNRLEAIVGMATHMFGPAGLLEQDDGENWVQSSRGTAGVVAGRYPLHYGMNLGRGEVKRTATGAAYIDSAYNEHAQLWLWQGWADWMNAPNWAALKRDRSSVLNGAM
jgi:nitrite reductase/ring-hydroxylating ferredoxin subunit